MIRTLLDITPDTVRLAERFGAKRDKRTLDWYVEGEGVPDELLNLVRKPMRTVLLSPEVPAPHLGRNPSMTISTWWQETTPTFARSRRPRRRRPASSLPRPAKTCRRRPRCTSPPTRCAIASRPRPSRRPSATLWLSRSPSFHQDGGKSGVLRVDHSPGRNGHGEVFCAVHDLLHDMTEAVIECRQMADARACARLGGDVDETCRALLGRS